jgi:hypothetical protein
VIFSTVETFGMNTAIESLKIYKQSMRQENLGDAALAGADLAEELVKEDMRENKTGRTWPALPRVSSREGETPAIQSLALHNSLFTEKLASIAPHIGRAKLETDHDHGLWMEYGFTTRDGAFHSRPFMRPIVDQNRADIQARMRDVMRMKQAQAGVFVKGR